jgi:hypothetical protein
VPADPLAPLAELVGVPEAARRVRTAVDEVHRHPVNRRGWPATAAEASMRAARASAALDGADPRLPGGPDGAITDPVLAGAVRVAESLGPLLSTWQRAPLQALARLHVLAAADLVSDDEAADRLGRPRADDEVSARLNLLAQVVTGKPGVPGVVLAAVVHGELLALEPFGTADGVVARAAARLTAVTTGLDGKGLAVPEVGHLRDREAYTTALAGFATGQPDGVRDWLLHCCQAWLLGAREARSIADAAGEPQQA